MTARDLSTPVLNEGQLHILRNCIGSTKVERALSAFQHQIHDILSVVQRPKGDIAQIAHQVSAAASTLGFEELAKVSRAVMNCCREQADDDVMRRVTTTFEGAAHRAAARLERLSGA